MSWLLRCKSFRNFLQWYLFGWDNCSHVAVYLFGKQSNEGEFVVGEKIKEKKKESGMTKNLPTKSLTLSNYTILVNTFSKEF